ncbi:MAG: hypothetical protein KDB66_11735 [Solirubrobacterales bacterium]|nr:hypothetical protein [Solirubrobacterales bacterium]MCB8915754.1 hypothetical protein [Thermoleophilales bacterium]
MTTSTESTVTLSGRAYEFGHMDTAISGATIRVREYPELSARTDGSGDYRLTVPDDSEVTPYIESGSGINVRRPREGDPFEVETHWNEIDLQTFRTGGRDLENVNFQTPPDAEFEALKALLQVPSGEDGRPLQSVIVTTACALNVRGVDYDTFWLNTPHGVAGATASTEPDLPEPVYFNELVIPDSSRTETSADGGIIWPIVPPGTYLVTTISPDDRFATFTATCAPGRIINANPPWGAFQLDAGETLSG